MVRRKLELKRIEDKSSRTVSFSKRRTGLLKKARHLSVLCDADVAVIVFNASGKLYQSSTGTTNSMERILSRYQKACLKEGESTTNKADGRKRFQTCKELLQKVDRLAENAEEFSVNDMTQLEQELNATLMQARLRKTHLMMKYVSTLKEQENKLSEENEELKKQVALAEESEYDNGYFATNQMNSPQLVTLPLFKA